MCSFFKKKNEAQVNSKLILKGIPVTVSHKEALEQAEWFKPQMWR